MREIEQKMVRGSMKDYKRLTFKRLVEPYDNDCEETENAPAAVVKIRDTAVKPLKRNRTKEVKEENGNKNN